MTKFEVTIEDLTVYACTIEAQDKDEAMALFHARSEEYDGSYYDTADSFGNCLDGDGYIEIHVYEENEGKKPRQETAP
tara:strand:+ start:567 stop:800 length:234 start_codon:yes stop_codon:yes gene_type:complete